MTVAKRPPEPTLAGLASSPAGAPGDVFGAIPAWLRDQCGFLPASLTSASEDASFRRYLRATDIAGRSRIVMDAPVANEDSRPFVAIAALLRSAGLRAPRIHAMDLNHGWLLLEDFGDKSFLAAYDADPNGADALYSDAIDALLTIQSRATPLAGRLPAYDASALATELALFADWFCPRLLGEPLDEPQRAALETESRWLIERILDEPVVFVHRDFHSRNLMLPPRGRRPGIIDFQDAVRGPQSYDLVSLLKDCYIVLEPERRERYLKMYLTRAAAAGVDIADPDAFRIAFRRTGIQRHLKIAGIFSRLNFRDGKARYLRDLPKVIDYLNEGLAHERDLPFLRDFVAAVELPALCHDQPR